MEKTLKIRYGFCYCNQSVSPKQATQLKQEAYMMRWSLSSFQIDLILIEDAIPKTCNYFYCRHTVNKFSLKLPVQTLIEPILYKSKVEISSLKKKWYHRISLATENLKLKNIFTQITPDFKYYWGGAELNYKTLMSNLDLRSDLNSK